MIVPSLGVLVLTPKENDSTNTKIRMCRVLKTGRLLCGSPMKKIILHIELINGSTTRNNKEEHYTHGCRLQNRDESFIKIDPKTLSETVKHPACLVCSRGPYSLNLSLKTHFLATKLAWDGRGTRSYIWFSRRAENSSFMAACQLGLARVAQQLQGIGDNRATW